MILTVLAVTVALQIGYIIGVGLRLALHAAPASSVTEADTLRGQPGGIG